MTIFFYPPEDDQPALVEKPTRLASRERVLSTHEAMRATQAAEGSGVRHFPAFRRA